MKYQLWVDFLGTIICYEATHSNLKNVQESVVFTGRNYLETPVITDQHQQYVVKR